MPIYYNGRKIKELHYGGRKIKEAYYNGQKVYSAVPSAPEWVPNKQYRRGDLVTVDGVTYRALFNHMSSSYSKPNTGFGQADYWARV